MKKVIAVVIITVGVFLFACNSGNNKSKETEKSTQVIANAGSPSDTTLQSSASTIKDLVSSYLQLKNALAADDGKGAAKAADEMKASLSAIDVSRFDSAQKKSYNNLADDIKEHTEHIGANASDIEHQREHFEMLSGDMIDLVKALGTTSTMYADYCPMYNNNKGGMWLSEAKEISNPYLGKKMPKCGVVKAEINTEGK